MDPNILWHLALAYYLKERYADAVAILEQNIGRRPDNAVLDYQLLAASYAQTVRPDEAIRAAEAVRRLNPFFEAKEYRGLFREPADAARVVEGLRKAGLD